jgi:hypothetical protein
LSRQMLQTRGTLLGCALLVAGAASKSINAGPKGDKRVSTRR